MLFLFPNSILDVSPVLPASATITSNGCLIHLEHMPGIVYRHLHPLHGFLCWVLRLENLLQLFQRLTCGLDKETASGQYLLTNP